MRLCDLSPTQVRRYFEQRLGTRFRSDSVKQVTRCCFHQDKMPSLSIDFAKGAWHCFTGCGSGGLIDFEVKFNGGISRQQAMESIFETLGMECSPAYDPAEEPEAIYPYTDEHGKIIFQKLRFAGKRFTQRMMGDDQKWAYTLKGARKPLYNLPSVITANNVLIAEGEKDADNVNRLRLGELDPVGFARVAATTNFDGGGHWDPSLSRYLAGKDVAILPDFDATGIRHAQEVATSVYDFASSVKVVQLPGLAEHGDVSDYLLTHSREELVGEIKRSPLWTPTKSPLLVTASEFLSTVTEDIDWIVEGVIQRGANGFIVSEPKVGKSWAAIDMALALCLGQPWMGFAVKDRFRVAVISREDHPGLTKWRMRQLLSGRSALDVNIDDMLYVNSRDQSPVFKLDVPEQLAEMLAAIKAIKADFVILDVLNVLHGADENDNTEMRRVMDCASIISTETQASLCIIHHFNKDTKNGKLTQRIRGAGALAGFVEWAVGLHRVSDDTEDPHRWAEFELKAASAPRKVFYSVVSDEVLHQSQILLEDAPVRSVKKRGGLA